MNKKNISPNPQQPVDRVPTGQLPSILAELSEESLGAPVLASTLNPTDWCSYDGDD
jgi:bacteriocin leader peptide (microcyclamide/patellamide family)